jgi:hypothetical protein
VSSEISFSLEKSDSSANATIARSLFAIPFVDERIQRMSYDALHDLGMTDKAIGAYLGRFGKGDHASQPRRSDTAAGHREERAVEPFFGGGDWHWGVRASKPDFW